MASVVPLFRVVGPAVATPERADPWARSELVGRLVELSGQGASAVLTISFGLVVAAQRDGEPVAWISARNEMFYPPDAAASGVDLETMVVVRTRSCADAGKAADKLLRSGAFGLVVLDLGGRADLSTGLQARLVKLGQKHGAAVICLTEKPPNMASLSSLVSLRCTVSRTRKNPRDPGFSCEVKVLKDKRRGPQWHHQERCDGPPSLR